MGRPHAIGIVGLGVISGQYLATLREVPGIRVAAVTDLDAARAESVAAGLPGCRPLAPDALYADGDVETVLNLTVPAAHAEVGLAAIANGKHLYGEKPLAATLAEARRMTDAAATTGVHLGSAPDTVLGTGIQTARALVDDGRIGRPVSAAATWIAAGHEAWHPNPDFYYRRGGGPLMDMGPYYITSLVHLLGSVVAVSGAAARVRDERVIASGPRAGEQIPVEVDTHVTGILHHDSGAISTVTMSFDGVSTTAAHLEVHGDQGLLVVPDPNVFDGDVSLRPRGGEWERMPPSAGYVDAGRGIGLVDFVHGSGRASGALGLHVLEVMTLLLGSAASGVRMTLTTRVERPELVPLTPAQAWRNL